MPSLSRNNAAMRLPTVTNKEICLVRIVFIYAYNVVLFCSLGLIEKKTFFPRNWICCSTPLLRHNRYVIIKFQIDLVILASSKNFVGRLHN